MIKQLKIQALKSIKDETIDLTNLNVFVGTNSSGKSTILQSLLIASQALGSNLDNSFDGEFIKLGSFEEVRSKLCNKDNIKITIVPENEEETCFEISEKGILEIDDFGTKSFKEKRKDLMKLSYKELLYHIPFDRIGVAETYPKNQTKTKFGLKCECALSYFDSVKRDPKESKLDDELIKDKTKGIKTLDSQVNYWLNTILGYTLHTQDENLKSSFITASYTGSDGKEYRPLNVGSGISYIISILIVCLASEKDSVIIIENPEIHLHPKAQSKLTEFLYFIAESGRQLFIETHSDHIFNGIRTGIATHTMDSKKIAVNFVTCDEIDGTEIDKVEFDEIGSVINPLPDLFDQFELDLNRMLGL